MFDHVAMPRINREINVTPMIDVLLVLLIIAIILNMTRHTIRVAAAEPPAHVATAPAPQLVLALPAAGGFELNGQPVPREALVEVLRGAISHRSSSVVFVTSAPNRTSPVVRGRWLIESLLGAKVPSPPPGAEADLSAEASESEGLVGDTVRARLELHRANPTCAGCHGIMDPLGLSLENFDLLGRWREQEDGHSIDARAEMADGTQLLGPRLPQVGLEQVEQARHGMPDRRGILGARDLELAP